MKDTSGDLWRIATHTEGVPTVEFARRVAANASR